ncbi:MAG: thiamine diphosphokinase [Clostridiales bacterium]|nr:thiamine diphosphokinase [Clostridiales bacterium]
MSRSCLILTGGRLDPVFARSYLEERHFDVMIAVDGGLEPASELGMIPDYIVGDFDTVSPMVLERFRANPHIVWEQHKPEKDETDTELARSLAVSLGVDEMVFLGATGGRLDHMLGNIHALYECLKKGIHAEIIDRQNRLYLLDKAHRFDRDRQWGKYVSFLPYTEVVQGITLCGFRYPLEGKDIRRGEEVGLCVSNEIVEETACIRFERGILICVESRD